MEASNAKRRLALEGTRDESSSDKSAPQDDDDEDVSLISRRSFNDKKNFFKRRPKRKPTHNGEEATSTMCFECNKPGHLKKDCLLLKEKNKKMKNKKALYIG